MRLLRGEVFPNQMEGCGTHDLNRSQNQRVGTGVVRESKKAA